MTTRSVNGPIVAIIAGIVIIVAHLALGVTGVLNGAQWISGGIIGLLVAGVGNHVRIFGRR
jgi:hypothetical protein